MNREREARAGSQHDRCEIKFTKRSFDIRAYGSIIHIALNSLCANRLVRSVIVAMTLVGWLVLSNHCALGSVAKQKEVKAEHACCHNGTSPPAKEPLNGGQGLQCCRSIHVIVSDTAKLTDVPVLFAVEGVLDWSEARIPDGGTTFFPTLHTGPPLRAASFSELVLHRSLRSHAPPFLA